MKVGDRCRSKHGSPARYIGDGLCLWVCAQDNDLGVSEVGPGEPSETLPHPSDGDVWRARSVSRVAFAAGERAALLSKGASDGT